MQKNEINLSEFPAINNTVRQRGRKIDFKINTPTFEQLGSPYADQMAQWFKMKFWQCEAWNYSFSHLDLICNYLGWYYNHSVE